jgi:signal transduction histidine kinase
MPKDNVSKRITTLIVVFPLLVLLIYGLLSHIFFFYYQNNEVKKELVMYEKTLMDAQRDTLREKVENLVQFIRYYDGRSSQKIKDDVKNIVNVTADIANNLYAEYHNKMSEYKLKEIIKSALREIKFEGDIGYLFLVDLKGFAHLHVDPQIEGTNILNLQDIKGKYIIKEFNRVLKEKGEGFVDYYWYIVSEDKKEMHYKISFVKMLKCYDWYIGAGEYLKYMKKFVKRDILEYIKDNASFNHGYFFILNSKQEVVFHPLKRNLKETKRGKKIGFSEDDEYLSYTQYVAEYDWYLTANRSLTKIRASIENKKQNSQIREYANIKTNLYILMFTWLVSIFLSLYLSMTINSKLKSYQHRLHNANEKLIFQSRQALIGELFSMIAHQWRQPINKVASILALLRYKLLKKEITHKEIDKKCQNIEESIEFMSETIDDFRTFYQPKDESEDVDLKELIEKSIYFLESSILKKNNPIVRLTKQKIKKIFLSIFLSMRLPP